MKVYLAWNKSIRRGSSLDKHSTEEQNKLCLDFNTNLGKRGREEDLKSIGKMIRKLMIMSQRS